MGTFTKNIVTKGKFKSIVACEDGTFIDDETGEEIKLGEVLHRAYGNTPFELNTSLKLDQDI